ncbi:MAG: hypothetical protein AAF125_19285, partial [Chloroflexota bacterium]
MTQHDWDALLRERFTPETRDHVGALLGELQDSPLPSLSAYVRGRLKAAAFYSVLTYPASAGHHYRFAMAYFIGWVFGMDELMDNCPTLEPLDQLMALLAAQSDAPLGAPLPDTPPTESGVAFTVPQLVAALEPLRRCIIENAAEPDGVSVFDESLQEGVGEIRRDHPTDTDVTVVEVGLVIGWLRRNAEAPLRLTVHRGDDLRLQG